MCCTGDSRLSRTTIQVMDLHDVCLAWRAGNRMAGDELLRRNVGLVKYFARRCQGSLSFDEAAQCARLAVLRAAKKWDDALGAFSTYASIWIRSMLRRERLSARVIWIPHGKHDKYASAAVEEQPAWYRPAVDIDEVYDDETASDPAFLDEALPADECIQAAEEQRAVIVAMARLSARERGILRDHVMEEEKTLQAIGDELGVSRERVRQIEESALRRLHGKVRHAA